MEQVQPRTHVHRLGTAKRVRRRAGRSEGARLVQGLACGCRPHPARNGGPVHLVLGLLHDRRRRQHRKTGCCRGSSGLPRPAPGTDRNREHCRREPSVLHHASGRGTGCDQVSPGRPGCGQNLPPHRRQKGRRQPHRRGFHGRNRRPANTAGIAHHSCRALRRESARADDRAQVYRPLQQGISCRPRFHTTATRSPAATASRSMSGRCAPRAAAG